MVSFRPNCFPSSTFFPKPRGCALIYVKPLC